MKVQTAITVITVAGVIALLSIALRMVTDAALIAANRWETESPDQLRTLNRECFEQGGRSTVRVAVAAEEEPRTYHITCQK